MCRPIAIAIVFIGSTLRMIDSSVSDAPSGTRRMNSIMLYGFGPSNPPPMATQVRFSGPGVDAAPDQPLDGLELRDVASWKCG